MWKKRTVRKRRMGSRTTKTKNNSGHGVGSHGKIPKEWISGRHWCGHGYRGWIVSSHGLTFCNLCGKEK